MVSTIVLLTFSLCQGFLSTVNSYDLTWSVDSPENGNRFGQEETRTEDVTAGRYYVLLPDGRLQTVIYRVDKDSGYVADIFYERPNTTVTTVPTDMTSTSPNQIDIGTRLGPNVPVGNNEFPILDDTIPIPPNNPAFDQGSEFDFAPPDYPNVDNVNFAPDYPGIHDISGSFDDFGGGLFPEEEEIALVPDPIVNFFAPPANRPITFPGIPFSGIDTKPIVNRPNNNVAITFPTGNASPEPTLPPTNPILPNTGDLGALLNFFQNNNVDSAQPENTNSLNTADASLSYDPDFPVPPEFNFK